MILVTGKNKGKRLVRMATDALQKNGAVELAALSMSGAERLLNACWQLKDLFRLEASDVDRREVQMDDGEYRVALVVRLEVQKHGSPQRYSKEM